MDGYGRRTILRGTGLAVAGVLAGCGGNGDQSGGDGSSDGGSPDGDEPTDGPTETQTETQTASETETETDTETETATERGPLRIEHVRFVTGKPSGFREYSRVEDPTYSPGETVWVYYEPKGMSTEDAGGDAVQFSLTISLNVTDSGDERVITKRNDVSRRIGPEQDLSEVFLAWRFDLPENAREGKYTATVGVADRPDSGRVSESVQFTVTSGTDFKNIFTSTITDELDVEIERFAVTDGIAKLIYGTPYEAGSGDSDAQIGFIAGAYATLIDSGWDTDELQAQFTDATGSQYRWRIEAATAQQYMDGDISEDEYVRRIFESVHEV